MARKCSKGCLLDTKIHVLPNTATYFYLRIIWAQVSASECAILQIFRFQNQPLSFWAEQDCACLGILFTYVPACQTHEN